MTTSFILRFFDGNGFGYLDRVGFFEHLNKEVVVRPKRPQLHKSQVYKGNTHSTVEFGEISLTSPDNNVPIQLRDSFVVSAGEGYKMAAFTIISESFVNAIKHSQTPVPGFVALQLYKNSKQPHLQTVISDSGLGIINTLQPIFDTEYEHLAKNYDLTKQDDQISLILQIFNEGGISREGCGCGAGLKVSGNLAAKYKALISIRQETFEVHLKHVNGIYEVSKAIKDMPILKGTHICFDFFL